MSRNPRRKEDLRYDCGRLKILLEDRDIPAPVNGHMGSMKPQHMIEYIRCAKKLLGMAPNDIIPSAIDENNPIFKLAEAAKDHGMHSKVVDTLISRTLRVDSQIEEKLTTAKLIASMEEKIQLTLHYMDDVTAANASYKELASVLTMLTEKRQLLSGEPTQLISHEERKSLPAIMAHFAIESRRRSVTITQVADG